MCDVYNIFKALLHICVTLTLNTSIRTPYYLLNVIKEEAVKIYKSSSTLYSAREN